MRRLFYITIFLSGLVMLGCNDFNRLQKSTDLAKKYDAAVAYYDKKDYTKAQMLLDELYTVMRGTDKAENVAYLLAYSYYNMGDYVMSGYLFKTFFSTYPVSTKAAECLYMSAYCHYLVSPPYTLDQEDTKSAIEEFQYFIQMFPTDTARIHECNKLVDNLHKKLEKKAFYNAKMYYDIEEYYGCITAMDQFMKDYPDTHYAEDVAYYKVMAKFQLAANSVESKKATRVADAITACNDFMVAYKVSEYTDEIKAALDKAQKMKKQIDEELKTNPNQ